MRSLMETDHRNLDALMKEVETSRTELRLRADAIDRLRTESITREEEVKTLRRSHELCVELKEALRKEENERIQVSARLEQVTSALEAAREAIAKQQAGLSSVGLENQLATRELQELRATANTVADVSRENERLKARLESSKVEILELTHKLSSSSRDISDSQYAVKELERRLATAGDEISTLKSDRAALEKRLMESSQVSCAHSSCSYNNCCIAHMS